MERISGERARMRGIREADAEFDGKEEAVGVEGVNVGRLALTGVNCVAVGEKVALVAVAGVATLERKECGAGSLLPPPCGKLISSMRPKLKQSLPPKVIIAIAMITPSPVSYNVYVAPLKNGMSRSSPEQLSVSRCDGFLSTGGTNDGKFNFKLFPILA